MCGLWVNRPISMYFEKHNHGRFNAILRLLRPNRRPPFVDEDGGGGFWICDAVGARELRME